MIAVSHSARGTARKSILNDGDIAKAIAVAGMLFVCADDAPSGGFAQTQTVVVVGKHPTDELAVSEPGGLGLSHAHQLPANAIAAKRAPHKNDNFADLADVEPFFVGLDGNETADQIAHFGDEQGMPRILLRRGNQPFLIFDRTQGAIEGGEAVFDSVVKDFAKSRRVILTRWANVQMRTLLGSGHRVILTSEMS